MVHKLFFILILIFGSCVYAQQSDLTHGKGTNMSADGITHERQGKNSNGVRKRHMPPYKIKNSRYVSRSTITKSINKANEVRIKIKMNGIDNTDIEDFSMAYTSGTEYRMSNIYGIQNTSLPLYVKVTYRSWNAFHAVQNDVIYEFTIFAPGTWDVTISN